MEGSRFDSENCNLEEQHTLDLRQFLHYFVEIVTSKQQHSRVATEGYSEL